MKGNFWNYERMFLRSSIAYGSTLPFNFSFSASPRPTRVTPKRHQDRPPRPINFIPAKPWRIFKIIRGRYFISEGADEVVEGVAHWAERGLVVPAVDRDGAGRALDRGGRLGQRDDRPAL